MRVRVWLFVVALGLIAPILLVTAPPPARGVSPAVVLSMQGNPATGDPADVLTYTIFIDNQGPQVAPSLWVNDTLPPGLQYRGFLGPLLGASCTNSNRFVNCTMVPIPAFTQTSRTWTINATIPTPLPPGFTIVNRVFVNYTDNDGTLLQEKNASAALTISTSKITAYKIADSNRVPPRGTLGYTIFCNNTGQLEAPIAWINDTLPKSAGLPAVIVVSATPAPTSQTASRVQWQLSNLGSGFHSVTLIVQALPALGDGTVLTNVATVNYTDANGNDRPGSRSNASTTVSVNVPAIIA